MFVAHRLLALASLVVSFVAFAAPPGVPQRKEKVDVELSRKLTKEGDERYQQGDYAQAADLYFRAYEQFALRETIMGLALSFGRLQKYEQAIFMCDDMMAMQSYSGEAAECAVFNREFARFKATPVNTAGCKSNPAKCRADGDAFNKGSDTQEPRPQHALALYLAACDANDGLSCSKAAALQKYGVSFNQRWRDHFSTTVRLYRRACELGVGSACGQLASYLVDRSDLSSDALEREVFDWLSKRCQEDAKACSGVGSLLNAAKTRTVTRDQTKALELFTKACDAGAMHGCNMAGRRFAIDKEKPDLKKAVGFYTKACEGGEGVACVNLAGLHSNGLDGAAKDPVTAAKFYARACELGDLKGCDSIGVLYQDGRGFEKDLTKAFAIYERTCAGGLAASCKDLGDFYTGGKTVPKDPARALDSYRKGCDFKNWASCTAYTAIDDPRRSRQMLFQEYSLMACDAGDLSVCIAFADWILKSGSREYDGHHPIAALYRRACDAGITSQCSWALRLEMRDDPKTERTGIPAMQALCDKKDKDACDWLEKWKLEHPVVLAVSERAEFDQKRKAGDVSGLNLNGYSLEGENLEKLVAKKTTLVGASLARAKLGGANLVGAQLMNADLRGADLTGADLSEANLTNANLVGAVLNGTVLRETNFTKANLQKLDLRQAKATGAWFTETDLRGADLSGMSFNRSTSTWDGVRLDEAKLDGASFSGASFGKVDFRQVNLRGVKLGSPSFTELHVTREQVGLDVFSTPSVSQLFVYGDVCAPNTESWRLRFQATSVTQFANGSRCR